MWWCSVDGLGQRPQQFTARLTTLRLIITHFTRVWSPISINHHSADKALWMLLKRNKAWWVKRWEGGAWPKACFSLRILHGWESVDAFLVMTDEYGHIAAQQTRLFRWVCWSLKCSFVIYLADTLPSSDHILVGCTGMSCWTIILRLWRAKLVLSLFIACIVNMKWITPSLVLCALCSE